MPGFENLISHAVPFLLVVFRLAGLFVFAPLLSSTMVPRRIRALMVVMLGAAIYPLVPPASLGAERLDIFALLPMIVTEAVLGLSIGVIATIPLVSLEMSGVIMGQKMGFGLARVYNPELEFDADLLGQLFFYLGAGAFIAMGGLESLFLSLGHTFDRVPVGAMTVGGAPLDLMLGVLTSGFELAMRVAAPVAGMVLLLVVLFSSVSKTMPQLNVMTVGFTVKIVAGLAIAALAVGAMGQAAGIEIERVLGLLSRWVDHLGAAP